MLTAALLVVPFVASALLSTAPTGQKAWYWQNPLPQGNTLYGVATAGTANVWAVGTPGVVLYSNDAGVTWAAQDPNSQAQLRAVDFVDENTGWLVGLGGTVRATSDGGSSWTTQTPGTALNLYGVTFANASTGWVVGQTGTIRATTSGGASWVGQTSGTTQQLNGVDSVSTTRAWAVGNAATIVRTLDGSTWTTVAPPAGLTANLFGVDFVDTNIGYAVGAAATVLKTTDGGSTWTTQTVPVAGTTVFYSVAFTDASTGWIVGSGGNILYTTDGGATWTSQDPSTTADIHCISRAGTGSGWLVGAGGLVRRTDDSGVTWQTISQGTVADLNAVSIHDALTGWAVGNGGVILRTSNGFSWVAQSSGTTNDLLGVDFVSTTRGWAVGEMGTVLTTTDGLTWSTQSSGTTSSINAVDFIDSSTGWYVASDATLGRTTDGGSTWTTQTPASIATSAALNGVSFVDVNTGWAVGGVEGQPATVLKTLDGGSTWTTQTTPLPVGLVLRAVSAVDTQTAWAVGDTGALIRTVDGGATWTTVPTGVTVRLNAIHFEDALNGWYVGESSGEVSAIGRTTDGGVTWTTQNPGTAITLQAVDFANANDGVIVGLAGTILHTTDSSPPETTVTLDPADPDGTNGWYVTPPDVSFSTTEPAITYYSLNGVSGPWTTYSTPFTMTREGTITIAYYSIDPGGNRETTQTIVVKHDRGAPTTPTLLAASVTSTTATLTWAPSFDTTSGVAYYEVLQDGSVVGTSVVPAITLTGLTPETETTFTVRAYDVAGNVSGESDPAESFTLGELPRPPAIVYARTVYRNAVYLNWGETTGTVGPVAYRIYRALDGGAYDPVATVTVNYPGSWVDTSLVAPVLASYRVATIDARGEGTASVEATSATTTLTALPAPAGLRALATTAGVETSWTAVPGATGYLLYRSTTSTGAPSLITSPPVGTTSFVDTTTAIDTDYWYRVAAIDSSGVVGATGLGVFVHTLSDEATDSPHGEYDPFTDDCALCHRSHTSANSLALLTTPGDNEIALCLSCHDGTSAPDVFDEFSDPTMTSKHPVSVEDTVTVLRCGQCHTPHNDNGGPELGKLLYAPGGVRTGNAICYACHGTSTTLPRGDMTVFESSGHRASVPPPPDAVEVVCLACHRGHATRESALVPYSADQRCVWCHSAAYSLPGAADIAATLSGADSTSRHDLLEADQITNGSMITCANCHEPHVSAPGTPTVDPDDPSTAGGWTGTVVGLCLRCHDAELPTSAETSGWAPVPLGPGGATTVSNIATTWATAAHGDAVSTPTHLRPDMNYAPGDPLSCEVCHDPHGSSNRWGLAESVAASGTPVVVSGLTVVPVGAGADLRFFCGSCHIVGPTTHPDAAAGGADLTVWPIDCTAGGCHAHAGAGL